MLILTPKNAVMIVSRDRTECQMNIKNVKSGVCIQIYVVHNSNTFQINYELHIYSKAIYP